LLFLAVKAMGLYGQKKPHSGNLLVAKQLAILQSRIAVTSKFFQYETVLSKV
jgi:hypothetical protein